MRGGVETQRRRGMFDVTRGVDCTVASTAVKAPQMGSSGAKDRRASRAADSPRKFRSGRCDWACGKIFGEDDAGWKTCRPDKDLTETTCHKSRTSKDLGDSSGGRRKHFHKNAASVPGGKAGGRVDAHRWLIGRVHRQQKACTSLLRHEPLCVPHYLKSPPSAAGRWRQSHVHQLPCFSSSVVAQQQAANALLTRAEEEPV